MDIKASLTNESTEGLGLDIEKSASEIRRGIKQNFKFFRLINPFFSCKSEEEYDEYKKHLHTLLDETIAMKLCLFTRVRKEK